MLQVFSEKKDLVCEETGNGENDDLVTPTGTRDPLKFFDGTEFAKASAMMAQEFSNELALTEEEYGQIFSNLNDYLIDPVLGGTDFGNGCVNPDPENLFSQFSFDGTSKDSEDTDMKKNESGVFSVQQPYQPVEYQDEVEEIEQSTSSSVSPMDKSPPQLQQLVPMQQARQKPAVLPNIAFSNHGLLPPAPPINRSAPITTPTSSYSRVVRVNPQQQRVRTESNYSASSYSPPPTDGKSSNSRGAVYARQYRQKNREHTEQLEAVNDRLVKENDQLRDDYEQMRQDNDKLSREVTYLRQVLQNQSAIASILNSVACNAPGLKLQFPTAAVGQKQSDPIGGRTIATRASSKRKIDEQGGQSITTKRSKGNDGSINEANQSSGAGVCLHVNGDMVSVEFCSRCNREARCVDDQWKRQ